VIRLPSLEAGIAKLRKEISNLAEAVALTGGSVEALAQKLSQRQERLSGMEARLKMLKVAPDVLKLEVRRLEAEVRCRMDHFRDLLEQDPEEARKVIPLPVRRLRKARCSVSVGTVSAKDEDTTYRDIIDLLVEACRSGQGQIARKHALAGLWNANATTRRLPGRGAGRSVAGACAPVLWRVRFLAHKTLPG